ncbi:MAG: hypothetical protein ACRD4W_05125 [Nitrososphaeraceae archaeon]
MAVESSSSSSASSSKDDVYILCDKVLRINAKIRFVGIANHLGTLLASAYRHNLVPLLTREETAHYALQSILRSATREDFESKLGRQEYSIGKYQNVIRATVPIIYIEDKTQKENVVIEDDGGNKRNKVKFYLLLSFDVDYGVQHAIETKILPFIDENRKFFSTLSR